MLPQAGHLGAVDGGDQRSHEEHWGEDPGVQGEDPEHPAHVEGPEVLAAGPGRGSP